MKAIGVLVHGGPEALEIINVPEVNVGPGEIRIKNQASGVNPTDVGVRDGRKAELQKKYSPPYVPGMDLSGVVDQVGGDVITGIKVGDKVMAMVCPYSIHGAYREQIVLDQRAVVKVPNNTSFVEACTLPMNSLTARQSLDLLGLKRGQVLAVTGGPGAYGGYVIQLAKTEGLTVIVDSSKTDENLLNSLGADIIIPRGESYVDKIREHFPDGVDGLADGALLNEQAIGAVKNGGTFTSIRGFKGLPQREIKFTTTWVFSYDGEYEKLDTLRKQVEKGELTLRVADTVLPEHAAEAHRRLEAGGTRGRMVINWE
ncbi:NADP-dependent oxidoreductase [Alphaproteobacteria bacterium]|jgi:NADPH2:quinone reductase|nr:NADP-dependent oxidoreductase [Alphaproteobacteria bacterium]MDC0135043.1 NADP-dependent oxidoreductase [Alphaproteobacteria bacterium]MDC1209855.1 NADP-dependent oxidoreductase [Pseudomonadota bacterium]|tara:strand:+ start:274 stop:1215 length:942 start_codon:yes stop_codon:yes gene_type:complete